MRLLLDSANVQDIEKFAKSTAISGVTTNPSLIAKEPASPNLDLPSPGSKCDKRYVDRLTTIAESLRHEAVEFSKRMYVGKDDNFIDRKFHMSVEVTTLDPLLMVEQARFLQRKFDPFWESITLFIKIPFLISTLPVITQLSHSASARRVFVNATAVMTAGQARLAELAGANIVSFFYNRIKDGGGDPNAEIGKFARSLRQNSDCRIIAGSIRKPEDVLDAWSAGADFVTASPAVIEKLASHPQTDIAVKKFQEDIDAWLR